MNFNEPHAERFALLASGLAAASHLPLGIFKETDSS